MARKNSEPVDYDPDDWTLAEEGPLPYSILKGTRFGAGVGGALGAGIGGIAGGLQGGLGGAAAGVGLGGLSGLATGALIGAGLPATSNLFGARSVKKDKYGVPRIYTSTNRDALAMGALGAGVGLARGFAHDAITGEQTSIGTKLAIAAIRAAIYGAVGYGLGAINNIGEEQPGYGPVATKGLLKALKKHPIYD